MGKFYYSTLAGRPLRFGEFTFKFIVCSVMAGRASGIYESANDEETKILDAAVAGRRGVSEITAEEFAELKKKANPTQPQLSSTGSRPRVVRIPTLPDLPMEDAKSVVRDQTSDDEAEKPRPEPDTLVKVERVNPPATFAAAAERTKASAARATKAKAKKVAAPVDTAPDEPTPAAPASEPAEDSTSA